LEGSLLVDGPAEDVAAQRERRDFDWGITEFTFHITINSFT
jgi:hypothetical protein